MPTEYQTLTTHKLDAAAHTPFKSQTIIHDEDPAKTVFNDYRLRDPDIVNMQDDLETAEELLGRSRSHLLLVLNNQHGVAGILRAEDLYGEKKIKQMHDLDIKPEEMTVEMVMMPLKDVLTFSFDDVKHSKVGNIVRTIEKYERSYALVFEKTSGNPVVCGSFSISQIKKMKGESNANRIKRPKSISDLKLGE